MRFTRCDICEEEIIGEPHMILMDNDLEESLGVKDICLKCLGDLKNFINVLKQKKK